MPSLSLSLSLSPSLFTFRYRLSAISTSLSTAISLSPSHVLTHALFHCVTYSYCFSACFTHHLYPPHSLCTCLGVPVSIFLHLLPLPYDCGLLQLYVSLSVLVATATSLVVCRLLVVVCCPCLPTPRTYCISLLLCCRIRSSSSRLRGRLAAHVAVTVPLLDSFRGCIFHLMRSVLLLFF